MMKLVRLDAKSAKLFAAFDPFDYLGRQSDFATFALGCALETEGTDIPTGIVICYPDKAVIVVKWIYVAPSYRGQGISDKLLSAVYKIAENDGKKYVGALLTDEYGREAVCPDEENFFSFQGFDRPVRVGDGGTRLLLSKVDSDDEEEDDNGDLDELSFYDFSFDISADTEADGKVAERVKKESDTVVTAGDVFKCESFQNAETFKNPNKEVTSIGNITLQMLEDGIKLCGKKTVNSCYGEPIRDIPLTWFDPELSSCIICRGAVTGLFLVHKGDGRLWPEYLCSCGSDPFAESVLMMRNAAEALQKSYSEDTQIIVRCRNRKTVAMVEYLFS